MGQMYPWVAGTLETCQAEAPKSENKAKKFYVLRGQESREFYGLRPFSNDRDICPAGTDVEKAAKFYRVKDAAFAMAEQKWLALEIVRVEETTTPGTPVVSATL